jgi:hypothetical protein
MVMAGITILLSEIQSRIFMTESSIGFSLYIGLLADDKSILGILWYLLQISGIFFVGLVFLALFAKRIQRCAMAAFLLPLAFSFLVSLTPDISVNHKYVMISGAFLGMFWAWLLAAISRKAWYCRIVSLVLALVFLATGIYDFVIILKDNDSNHQFRVNLDSDVTLWLEENLTSQDLILTPEYAMNEVTMSGVSMYCAWPYYAWSAGYDTNQRALIATEIYTSDQPELVRELVEEEDIDYILYETDMTYEEETCREDIIEQLYPMVYQSENGRIRIYETR